MNLALNSPDCDATGDNDEREKEMQSTDIRFPGRLGHPDVRRLAAGISGKNREVTDKGEQSDTA